MLFIKENRKILKVYFFMKDISLRQKYPLLIFSAIFFPLITIIAFKIEVSLTVIIFSFLPVIIVTIMSYFFIKPLQKFLDEDSPENFEEITDLSYSLPFRTVIMLFFLVAGAVMIHLLAGTGNFTARILIFLQLFTSLLCMMVYTFFITTDMMFSVREKIFKKRNTLPKSIKRRYESLWKRIALTFMVLFFPLPLFFLILKIRAMEGEYSLICDDISTILFSMSLFIVPLLILFTRSLTRPLNLLISDMSRLKEEDFESGIAVITRDEIGLIADGLNHLSASLFSYSFLLRQRIARLNLLYNISQAANHIDSLDRVLSFVMDAILDGLSSEKASVMLIDENEEKLVTKVFKGIYSNSSENNYTFRLGEGIAGKVAREGKAIVANNGHRDPSFFIRPGITSDYKIRNLISVPMIIEDRKIGVVNVCNKKNEADYNDDDLDLLVTLSAQVAGIIEKFRLRQVELENIKKEKFIYMGRVAAGVAHEIKNPLNSIAMIIQRFKREFKPSEDQEEYINLLKIVSDEVRRVNEIVERFLKFARPKKLEMATVDFIELVKELVLFITPQAKEKNITIEENTEEKLLWNMDRTQMKQAILNILLNALEATPEGGKITVSLKQKGKAVFLKIKDTGSGIPEDLQSKIFELYFTTKSSGNGIGLCIAQKIIEQHNGTIKLWSEEGKGSEFIICLESVIL